MHAPPHLLSVTPLLAQNYVFRLDNENPTQEDRARERYVGLTNRIISGMLIHQVRGVVHNLLVCSGNTHTPGLQPGMRQCVVPLHSPGYLRSNACFCWHLMPLAHTSSAVLALLIQSLSVQRPIHLPNWLGEQIIV